MNTIASLLAASALGMGLASPAAASASTELRLAADPATDGVLMSWSLADRSIELLRENDMIFVVRKAADGSETLKRQVRLVVDGTKLVYLPTQDADGTFYIVTPEGALQLHDASGEIGFGEDAMPVLSGVREDQQKLLATVAPKAPDAEPSWTDVIESLGGGGAKNAGDAEGATEAGERVDPNRLEIVEQEDGTKLINDQFVLAGSGTKEDPYAITWDYLTSVRQTYRPREGLKDIAAHVKMLDGKYVKIGGYLQFPLAASEPKELLVMLNQWDGCCIGVPPTPYDAIEVSLATPATRGEKFAVEGALVGQLKIDPYLVGDWLIGLYLIGDASLDVSGSRSAQEVYGNSPTMGDPNAMPGR